MVMLYAIDDSKVYYYAKMLRLLRLEEGFIDVLKFIYLPTAAYQITKKHTYISIH